MPAGPSGPERRLLRSWKQIAAHLDVDVRTVQRWQARTDIPILREGTGARAHPSAYADELTAWLERRRHRLRSETTTRSAPTARWWWGAVALVLVAALGSAVYWLRLPGDPARLEAQGDQLRAFDADGRLCWERTIPDVGVLHTWLAARGDQPNFLIADVDDDGAVEVLLNIREAMVGEATGHLLCLDRRGRTRWRFNYGASTSWQGTTYSPKFGGRWIRKVRGPDGPYVAAGAVHALWHPAQVVLLDPRSGKLVEEYRHPGSLLFPALHDLDGDGIEELLVGGINNPGTTAGHGALVALSVPFSRARPATPARLASFTVSREAGYVLFPTPDVCRAAGHRPFVGAVDIEDGQILAQVSCGTATTFYYLDRSLTLQRAALSDGFAAVHDGLHGQNLLDHQFSEAERACLARVATLPGAVDSQAPEFARLWQGCQ